MTTQIFEWLLQYITSRHLTTIRYISNNSHRKPSFLGVERNSLKDITEGKDKTDLYQSKFPVKSCKKVKSLHYFKEVFLANWLKRFLYYLNGYYFKFSLLPEILI